ncbi:MAG: hypothetical protein O8C64_15135 [Candidatus Methanoperedens sp.]|nr:hypothetical protein [Candidatus Methanoperedens sp.]MCZ7403837.1 hypothetical protein [Candidatus Methanoperedens sp.]
MSEETLSQLIGKGNIIALVSLFLIYIVIFGFPNDLGSGNGLIISFSTIISYLILNEITKFESLRNILFKKALVKTEIIFRKKELKHDFYALPEEDRTEIDKIDKYFDKFVSDYMLSIFLVIFSLILIIAYKLGYLYLGSFNLQNFLIHGWGIIIGVGIINLVTYINSKNEIFHYVKNYEEVYDKNMGGKR